VILPEEGIRWAIYSTTWMPHPRVRECSAGEQELAERVALQTSDGFLTPARDITGYK